MMRAALVLLMVVTFLGCEQTNETVPATNSRVRLTVHNLPPLESGHYQLWGTFYDFNGSTGSDSPMHENEFVSFGEFNVATDGTLRSLTNGGAQLSLPAGMNPQLLKDIVIAVQTEHHDGLSKTSSSEPGSIIIGGAFTGTTNEAVADLTMDYRDAFSTAFTSVTGKCRIVAPTSPADSNSGIWFVDPGPPLSAGLRNLPSLPGSWRYEGWVLDMTTMQYHSTGKFAKADSADADGAGTGSGAGPGYNFPGQDFISGMLSRPNLLDNRYIIMVTIEPYPDNTPAPFALRLLTTEQTAIPIQSRTMTMRNSISASAPTARVVIQR